MGTRRTRSQDTDRVVADAPAQALPLSLRKLVRGKGLVANPLTALIRRFPRGQEGVFKLLHLSSDAQAQALCDAFDSFRRTGSRRLNLEEVIAKADLEPRDFMGCVARVLCDFNLDAGKAIFALNYPEMMEASMKRAKDPDATDERRMHFLASGHVPTSKGINIGIVNRNGGNDDPGPGEPTPFGRTARSVVRDLPKLPVSSTEH